MKTIKIKTWTLKEIREKRNEIFLEWNDSQWIGNTRLGFITIRNGNNKTIGFSKRISYNSYVKLPLRQESLF